jgi:hypothetical protein
MKKRSMERVEQATQTAKDNSQRLSHNLEQVAAEEQRVSQLSQSPAVIIEDLERDFKRATKLTDVDVAFLFLAVALQCVRQYLLTPATIRKDDQTAAKESGKDKEHSDRSHRLYNPSLDQILNNPVPFDALHNSNGALAGFGKLGHRGATPGHDPILGLIFGTANIATSTLTNWRRESWHIKTVGKHDVFYERAKNSLITHHVINKLTSQGMDGKILIGASVAKEIQHLKSDVYSTNSLPLPFVSAIDPKLAGELAARGLDMAAVLDAGKQFTYALAIDTLISMVHSMFYDESEGLSRTMYEVRTRRVLLYSNVIASASNVVVSLAVEQLGGNGARLADWGGYLNTLRHIVFDTKFINEVKRDFLKNELYAKITGPQYDFMEG